MDSVLLNSSRSCAGLSVVNAAGALRGAVDAHAMVSYMMEKKLKGRRITAPERLWKGRTATGHDKMKRLKLLRVGYD